MPVFLTLSLVIAALIFLLLAALSFFKPRILLALKKADLEVIRDAQDLSESTKELQKEGGNIEVDIDEDLKLIDQGEKAAKKITESL